jgi:hypothetical protein
MTNALGCGSDTGISWGLASDDFNILLPASGGQVGNHIYEIRYNIKKSKKLLRLPEMES